MAPIQLYEEQEVSVDVLLSHFLLKLNNLRDTCFVQNWKRPLLLLVLSDLLVSPI